MPKGANFVQQQESDEEDSPRSFTVINQNQTAPVKKPIFSNVALSQGKNIYAHAHEDEDEPEPV